MSTKHTATLPVFYKFADLDINPVLSRRSDKERRDNSKELAKEMQAHGEWDYMQPGQVATDGEGKPRVIAGFTRIAASELNGWKGGWFFELEGASELDIRLKAISTNGGRPVNRFQQGTLFDELRSGIVADDFSGATADPANAQDWKVQPMTETDIAASVGKSKEHVMQCLTIFESSPEIRTLLDTDQISYNVVIKAATWTKTDEGETDPAKQLRMLKRAIREAAGEKVTLKHLEAVKAEFVKQKAVTPPKAPKNTPADDSGENTGSSGNDEERGNEGGNEGGGGQELNLGQPEPKKPATKKEQKTIRDAVMTVLLETGEEVDYDLATRLCDRLIDAGLIVESAPF